MWEKKKLSEDMKGEKEDMKKKSQEYWELVSDIK